MSTHTNSSGNLRPIVRRAAAMLTAGALSFAGVTIAAADVAAAQSTRTTSTSSTYSSRATYGTKDADGIWWQKVVDRDDKNKGGYRFNGPFLIKYRLTNYKPVDSSEKGADSPLYSSEDLALGWILADKSGRDNRSVKNCDIDISIYDEDGDRVLNESYEANPNVSCLRAPEFSSKSLLGIKRLSAGDYRLEILVTRNGEIVGLPVDFTVHDR